MMHGQRKLCHQEQQAHYSQSCVIECSKTELVRAGMCYRMKYCLACCLVQQ